MKLIELTLPDEGGKIWVNPNNITTIKRIEEDSSTAYTSIRFVNKQIIEVLEKPDLIDRIIKGEFDK